MRVYKPPPLTWPTLTQQSFIKHVPPPKFGVRSAINVNDLLMLVDGAVITLSMSKFTTGRKSELLWIGNNVPARGYWRVAGTGNSHTFSIRIPPAL